MLNQPLSPKHPQIIPKPSFWESRTIWLLLFIVTIALSLGQTGLLKNDVVNQGGWPLVSRFLRAAFTPELSPTFLWLTLDATVVTLAYAICGTFLSLLIGTLLMLPTTRLFWQSVLKRPTTDQSAVSSFKILRNLNYRFPWLIVRALLAMPRGIHELLWGLFFINIFGLDPLTAILAITVPYGAIVAKIFSEILDDAPQQPYFAVINNGVGPLPAFLYTLIPQTWPDMLSYAFYRLECAIRAAAVLGVIGAGGLGYQILLSLQSLRYNELWTLFYALILLSGLVDLGSGLLRKRLRQSTNQQQAIIPPAKGIVHFIVGMFLFLLPFSFWYIQPDWSKLWSPRTYTLLSDILSMAFPPRLALSEISHLFQLSAQTLAMSILAALFASVGGLLMAFPAAHNVLLPGGILNPYQHGKQRALVGWGILSLTRLILLVARAIPAPIWALVLLFIFFPGILPGALALGIYNFGIIGRLVAEVVENLDERPLKALKAQGASGWQIFLYGALPLTLPRFIAFSLYRWEICIRATVIVGLVGAGGLGRLLTEQLSSFDYAGVTATLIFYIGLTFLVDLVSATVRYTLSK